MRFSYNTLDVELDKSTRSLKVLLNRKDQTINVETLFELEGLLSWLGGHIEVNAVILSSTGEYFSKGLDKKEFSIMSEEKFKKYLGRFQKLVQTMLHLPQTFICDLKKGTKGIGLELSLGADIRLANEEANFSFDSLQTGWVPCSGGIGLLSRYIGHSLARQWTLTSATIDAKEMKNKGLLINSYKAENHLTKEILQGILKQSPVARIQAKRSFLEEIYPELQRSWEYEWSFAHAAFTTEDWKKEDGLPFTSALEKAMEIKDGLQEGPCN
jgi:enoyl-CoA hydratase/carnithine racemase